MHRVFLWKNLFLSYQSSSCYSKDDTTRKRQPRDTLKSKFNLWVNLAVDHFSRPELISLGQEALCHH
jgi:hypothetical protein